MRLFLYALLALGLLVPVIAFAQLGSNNNLNPIGVGTVTTAALPAYVRAQLAGAHLQLFGGL